jgi:uncharacterized membrane protein
LDRGEEISLQQSVISGPESGPVSLGTPARPGRILSFDLARGLAVLFMVMVHVLLWYGTDAEKATPAGIIVRLLGGPPAAPVFVFLMGASQAFSRRTAGDRGLLRGPMLLALAYLLNLFRGTLPMLVGRHLGVLDRRGASPYTPLSLLWLVDILHFAGLALILLILVRRALPRPTAWLALAVLVAFWSPYLWGRMSGCAPLDSLLRLLWGTGALVAFPVFPWISYPLAGMAFGDWLAQTSDQDRIFQRAGRVGAGLLLLGIGLILTDPTVQLGDYFRSGPGAVLGTLGFVLVWLSACHWLVRHLRFPCLFNRLYAWSAHVTAFYVIHWLAIGWGSGLFGLRNQGWPGLALSTGVVVLLSDGATRLWVRLSHGALRAWTRLAIPVGS